MKRLNLGAGYDIFGGWVNVDMKKLPGIDVVHDLDEVPWPWDDGSIDVIRAVDVFEHVNDPLGFMNESGRVLKQGGVLRLRVPHWKDINAYSDPTHKRFCTEQSFDYWIKGSEFHSKYGAAYCDEDVAFEKIEIELVTGNLLVALRRT